MSFKNREAAAHSLSKALKSYQGQHPVVLAIPRGAVPMARIIADELGGTLDVVLVHKLGAPHQEELAIGAIDESGTVYLNPHATTLQVSQEYIQQEAHKQLQILQQRRANYTQNRQAIEIKNKIVIVVDDGIATGSTMMAALQALRAQGPAQLIIATAVAPPEVIEKLTPLVDQIICLETPENFHAVGQFFAEFPQVDDQSVIEILNAKVLDLELDIPVGNVILKGDLVLPPEAIGIVLFAHGSGSSRKSPRNQFVAKVLQQAHIGTLLFDLLTPSEDENYQMRFDIELLTMRLMATTQWLSKQSYAQRQPLAYFGASTGAAAALKAAALSPLIRTVVSRGGRPDLAMDALAQVRCATLLIVGGNDEEVIALNQQAYAALSAEKKLIIIPGATHLFEEAGALEQVASFAREWFVRELRL